MKGLGECFKTNLEKKNSSEMDLDKTVRICSSETRVIE